MSPADLKALRRRLGLTQAALAERLGMAPNSLARMERGERAITARTVAALEALRRLSRHGASRPKR